jgi:zinc protease
MNRRNFSRVAASIGMVGSLALAACSSTDDVDSGPSDSIPTTDASASTDPATTTEASTTEPDDGLADVEGVLDNGLRYVIRANDNPGGRVDMRLVVDAGSVDEDADQSGVAHFLEHMLFNGTEEFPENELVATLRSFGASFGADVNAYTSYDETVYELTMPTQDDAVVATGMQILEQWLTSATIDPVQVEAERGVVLDEWRGSATSAGGRIYAELETLLLSGSAYEGRDPIGTDEAISAMTAEPLRRFYDEWYRPDNAAVVVVGDVDPAEIEDLIRAEFEPAAVTGSLEERPANRAEVPSEPAVIVHADPDVPEGFAAVILPLVEGADGVDETPEAVGQREVLDSIAFEIIATRLGNDALRGEAPFDDASVDSSSIVEGLDAPEIYVAADGEDLEASTQAVLDEYERVRRYGFTVEEVDRAVESLRSFIDTEYAGRDTRQDSDFAEEYVSYVLLDDPIPTAEAEYEYASEVLDRATPETVSFGFVERLDEAATQMLVVVPESEVDDVASDAVFLEQILDVRDREIEPRDDDSTIDDALMVAPDPVEEVSAGLLAEGASDGFVAPVLLEFDNGVKVSLNVTPIVEGQVAFEARSPGGLETLEEADVPAADAAAAVLADSGVATYDPVSLEAFLSDKDLEFSTGIELFTEGMNGYSSTDDLEILLQLIHLQMTAPRVDELAVERYLDDQLPYAEDPSIDPAYAEYVALLDARYDDPRYLLPTVDSLSRVNAVDIDRVVQDRFGDASDWNFAFSGDLDIDEMTELARRYLGTLPGSGRVEEPTFVEPPPPAGVVDVDAIGGSGSQANLSFLFTSPASTDRLDDVAAMVVSELITARLTDVIREELGESYSPYAMVEVADGPTPNAETYISTSTGVELLADVRAAILGELDDLRANGPTETEYDSATESVRQQLDLIYNEQINDEVLSVLTDPTGNSDFMDYVGQYFLVDELDAATVAGYLAAWLPADQFISVTVTPR